MMRPGRKSLHKVLLLTVVTGLLASCGFQLRGAGDSADLPEALQTLAITSPDPGNGVVRALKNQLRRSGVTVVDTADSQTPELQLGVEQIEERITSLTSNARAGEFTLSLELDFLVTDNGETLIGPENLVMERVYLSDPENAIAKNEEAQQIIDEIRNDMAYSIIRQLQSYQPEY